MAYEQRPNSGSLFINNKRSSDKSPDLTGTLLVGDTKYNVSGWRKTTRNGDEWISLSVSIPQQKDSFQSKPAPSHGGFKHGNDPDDSIPF